MVVDARRSVLLSAVLLGEPGSSVLALAPVEGLPDSCCGPGTCTARLSLVVDDGHASLCGSAAATKEAVGTEDGDDGALSGKMEDSVVCSNKTWSVSEWKLENGCSAADAADFKGTSCSTAAGDGTVFVPSGVVSIRPPPSGARLADSAGTSVISPSFSSLMCSESFVSSSIGPLFSSASWLVLP